MMHANLNWSKYFNSDLARTLYINWLKRELILKFFWRLVMQIVFKLFFFSLLLTTSYASSVCMADCGSLITPRPPSIYEQYCCNSDNSGKTIKWRENNRVNINFCPSKMPASCQRFLRFLQTVRKPLKRTILHYLDTTEWMDLMVLFFLSTAI